LPEVIQDAGLLIDPNDIQELASSMYQVISDKGLRKQMKSRSLEVAAQFSWEKTAKETLEVFKAVFNETQAEL